MSNKNPYAQVYGLTGIMGSGKSTVAKIFAQLGATVLDADEIAKFVIHPTSPYYAELRAKISGAFQHLVPEPLFGPDGSLKRALLGQIAFHNQAGVTRMNQIMHPPIQAEFSARVFGQARPGVPIIYDVPLLFEGGLEKAMRGTILVYAPETMCIERAVRRAREKGENLSADTVRARLAAQISIEKKRELADHIIDNSGPPEALEPQVTAVYQRLNV